MFFKKIKNLIVLCSVVSLNCAMEHSKKEINDDFIIVSQIEKLNEFVIEENKLEFFFQDLYKKVPTNISDLLIFCQKFHDLEERINAFGQVLRLDHSSNVLTAMFHLNQKVFMLRLKLNNLRDQALSQLEGRASSIFDQYEEIPKNMPLDRKDFDFFRDMAIGFRHDVYAFSMAFSSEKVISYQLLGLKAKLAEIEELLASLEWQEEFGGVEDAGEKERLDDSDQESTPGAGLGED